MDLESDVHETPDLPNPTLELISPDSFTGVDQDLTQLADGVHSVRFQQNGKAVSSSVLVKRSLSDITVSYSLDGVGYESIMKPNGVSYTTVSTPRGEGLPPIRTVVKTRWRYTKNR